MIFRLFEDIRMVKGHNRTALMDLTREKILFIPHFFAEELERLNGQENYKKALEKFDPNLSESLIQFIETNEIGFECKPNENNFFPPLDTTWKTSGILNNVIIEIGAETQIEWIKLIEAMGCFYFEFRVYDIHNLKKILTALNDSRIRNIALVFLEYPKDLEAIIPLNSRTTETHIFNANKNTAVNLKNVFLHTEHFENRVIVPQTTAQLAVNMSLYTESQKHNTYFNQKLFINQNGTIKNTPETSTVIGEMKKTQSLAELKALNQTNQSSFPAKSFIDICSACEFRHACVCNRVPKQRKNQTWYFEEECAYNPYISQWKTDEHYLPLQKCGIQCDKNGLYIDQDHLNNLIDQIWSE